MAAIATAEAADRIALRVMVLLTSEERAAAPPNLMGRLPPEYALSRATPARRRAER
jgi:hypothetical protein